MSRVADDVERERGARADDAHLRPLVFHAQLEGVGLGRDLDLVEVEVEEGLGHPDGAAFVARGDTLGVHAASGEEVDENEKGDQAHRAQVSRDFHVSSS